MSSASNTDSRKTLFLHVGLDKAGSTSLQSHVFPNIKGFEYPLTKKQDRLLGKLFRESAYNQELIDGISDDPIESSRLTRKPVGISTSDDELVEFIRDRIEGTKSRKIILSNEGLWRFVPSRIEQIFLRSLPDLVSSVKIIIIVRRQGELLPSRYAQGAHFIPDMIFDNYVKSIFSNESIPPNLNFEKFIDPLIETFGIDSIYIASMEALFDPANKNARHHLGSFMGIDSNFLEAAFSVAKPANQRSQSGSEKITYNLNKKIPSRYSRDLASKMQNISDSILRPLGNLDKIPVDSQNIRS